MFSDDIPDDVRPQPLADVLLAEYSEAFRQLTVGHRLACVVNQQSSGIGPAVNDDWAVHVTVLLKGVHKLGVKRLPNLTLPLGFTFDEVTHPELLHTFLLFGPFQGPLHPAGELTLSLNVPGYLSVVDVRDIVDVRARFWVNATSTPVAFSPGVACHGHTVETIAK